MAKLTAKLADLAAKAGRWLGLAAPAAHTHAVEADRFDEMTWREITDQAGLLRQVIEDLGERHDYAGDLARDVFLAAYKASPVVRPAGDMDPSRLVNRAVVAGLLDSPEFAELRRETAGDAYESAMAVIAQAGALRRALEQAEDAQQAADEAARARREEQDAAAAVQQAVEQATSASGEDGSVPDGAAAAVQAAIGGAEQASEHAAAAAQAAGQALAGAVPGLHQTPRPGRVPTRGHVWLKCREWSL
jgi:hypothetical protein